MHPGARNERFDTGWVSRATPSPLAVALQARPPVAVCRILLHKLRACVTQPVSPPSLITFYRFSAVPRAFDCCCFFFFLLPLTSSLGKSRNRYDYNFFSRKSARSILDLASGRRRIDRWCTRGFPRRSVGRAGGGWGGGGGTHWWSCGSRKIYITRNTGVTYKPRTGSGHSAPAQSRIQIGGTLNWVNVRIYRVTGISRKSYSPHLGSERRDSRLPTTAYLHEVFVSHVTFCSSFSTYFKDELAPRVHRG